MNNDHKPIVRSAARALDVLEIVVQSNRAPNFAAIQEQSGIPKSSLSNLLKELVQTRYLQCDRESRTYYPGTALLALSAECMSSTNFSLEINNGLKHLAVQTGETAHVAVRDGRFAVFIGKQNTGKAVSSVLNIGFKLGAHATGCGLILLAALPDADVHQLLDGVELERYTPWTITDHDRLFRELHWIRRYGFAFDNQGNVLGGCCLAAPIYDQDGSVAAAVSVSFLASKAKLSYIRQLVYAVRSEAKEISQRLGCIRT